MVKTIISKLYNKIKQRNNKKQKLKNTNYLKLYIGPMFSGKTSHLLKEINNYKKYNSNILVVNHIFDQQRHSSDYNSIKTHNNKSFPAIMIQNLSELHINHLYHKADIIIIDEAQFFIDLHKFIFLELNKTCQNKIFIVAGLSGDYQFNSIGDILRLIPLADEIHKLTASCIICNNPASFTKKNNINKKQIEIGNSNIYSPVCRLHHANN